MPADPAATLIGAIIGNLIGAAIGSLIGAILLRSGAKWVVGLDIPYGRAYVTVFIGALVGFAAGLVAGFVFAGAGATKEQMLVLQVAMIPIGFVIQTAVTSWQLELSFGRAALVVLVMLALGLAIALLIGLIIGIAVVALR